jgi:ATP adenylyltransferase
MEIQSGCPFCEELDLGNFQFAGKNYGSRILYESKHCMVFPTLGAFIDGYLLIVSKDHYASMATLPNQQYEALEETVAMVRDILEKEYGPTLFFEHGPADTRGGGCCIDHAHLHCVPISINLMTQLEKKFKSSKITALHQLAELKKPDTAYLFLEDNNKERFFLHVEQPLPSQFIRQILANHINRYDEWNWRRHPNQERMLETYHALKDNNKFRRGEKNVR